MGKLLRYLILFIFLVFVFSVIRGMGGAFKGSEFKVQKSDFGSLPGLEAPSDFVRSVTSRAIETLSGAVLGVTNNISQKVADTITDRATEEVSKNFQNLNEKEKEILKKAICVPSPSQ